MKKTRKRKFIPIHIKTSPMDNRIILTREIRYKKIAVPKGYKSDGLTKLINKYSPDCLRAALIHDYCCETKCISRKKADRYFYELLRLDGVKWLRAKRYYLAVRVYATIAFKR